MTSLINLPIEIIGLVLESLRHRDLLALRRTCREMNARTAHLVVKRYFKKRFVMFERRSLECLEAIARSPTLGPCVRELEICTIHLLPVREISEIEPAYSEYENVIPVMKATTPYGEWSVDWGSDDEEAAETEDEAADELPALTNRLYSVNLREYPQAFDDQEEISRTNDDIKSLTRAMKLLNGCRQVSVSSRVRAWGLRSLRHRIGILPQRALTFESTYSIKHITHIINAVLVAAAESQIPIETLAFGDEGELENANRLIPSMLIGQCCPVLAQNPLVSLRELLISLDTEVPSQIPNPQSWESGLTSFVQWLPDLSNLELSFMRHAEDDEHHRFSGLSRELYIPKLHTLILDCIDCTRWDMAFFLLRHNCTLRVLELSSVELGEDTKAWCWLVKVIRDSLQLDQFSIQTCRTTDDATGIELDDITITNRQGFTDVLSLLTAEPQ